MSDHAIENARVPDLEVLALQQQLNHRVRAGLLSGPLLQEHGRLDEATRAKQAEQEAVDAIALAVLDPERPASAAELAAARTQDEALLAELQGHLAAIPDTPYMDFDHKGPSVARVQAIAAAFRRKWEAGTAGGSTGMAAIPPGGLVFDDGAFDWPALEAALGALKQAEQAFSAMAPDAPERPGRAAGLTELRRQIVTGLHVGPGSRPRQTPTPASVQAPVTPAAPTALPTGPLAAPAATPTRPMTRPPAFVPDPERERLGRELDILGPERRGTMLREAAAASPEDPRLPALAASLARTHPETATPGLASHFDAYACHELSQDEGRLGRIPPAARAGMLKVLAGREGEGADALFSAIGASLLRHHPHAASEVLGLAPETRRGALAVSVLGKLTDEEASRLGKDVLHQVAKGLQAGTSPDTRRQLARLVRLMGSR